MHQPTPEQQAIIYAAINDKRSLIVQAGAGTAKTTTLEMIANAMPSSTIALCLAFNRRIVDEMEKRLPKNFQVKSLNGLGHSAWTRTLGKGCSVDEKKLGKIVTQVFRDEGYDGSREDWDTVRALATGAMNRGLVPRGFTQKGLVLDNTAFWRELSEDLIGVYEGHLADFTREVILRNIKQAFAGVISYDDQIYMSTMFGGVFPRYPLVLVDEAQDLGTLNHMQLRRCASDRLIVVGDVRQAIYAFRGADSDSINKIRALRQEWIELPLNTSFRCPKKVVVRQQDHAPGFTAWHTNPDGEVQDWRLPHAKDEPPDPEAEWDWRRLEAEIPEGGTTAILCRNNGPLLSIAFKLLRSQVGVYMLGRDIGKGLLALSRKLLPEDDLPVKECLTTIQGWMQNEVEKAMQLGQEEKCDGIEDRASCLLAVLAGSGAQNAGGLRSALSRLFSRENGRVTLGTGHRAKGLEYDCVLHLDPWRVPSRWAQKAADEGDKRQLKQEDNLRYVIETRTKHTLILANLEDFV